MDLFFCCNKIVQKNRNQLNWLGFCTNWSHQLFVTFHLSWLSLDWKSLPSTGWHSLVHLNTDHFVLVVDCCQSFLYINKKKLCVVFFKSKLFRLKRFFCCSFVYLFSLPCLNFEIIICFVCVSTVWIIIPYALRVMPIYRVRNLVSTRNQSKICIQIWIKNVYGAVQHTMLLGM